MVEFDDSKCVDKLDALHMTDTGVDSAGAARLEFRKDGEPVFTISADNKVTLHGDTTLDEASLMFWKGVERNTPQRDLSTDNDGQLARMKVVPVVRGGKPQGYDILIINGVAITGMRHDSLVAQKVSEALEIGPKP